MGDLNLAIVKHNLQLGTSGDLPEDFSVGAYAAAGGFLDEYEDKKGRIRHKEGACAGAGLGFYCEPGLEIKGPSAGAGFEGTADGAKAVAKAEVYSTSVSLGAFGLETSLLKAGAGIKAGEDGLAVKFEAKLGELSTSAGPVKATVGLSADTGFGVGENGVDVKFLGTGFKAADGEIGFSVFGSGFSFKLW